PDIYGDGVPDSLTPIPVTPDMAAGNSYCILIAAQVPRRATPGQQSQLTITTNTPFNNTDTDSNTDTDTLNNYSVVPFTKALSIQSGPAGTGPITVTFTFNNNGGAPATNLTLTDALDSRYVYVAGSGRWSTTNPTALTDGADGAEAGGIQYNFN